MTTDTESAGDIVEIIPVTGGDDALNHHYPDQTDRQDTHLEIDLEHGQISCDYNPEVGNGIPMRLRHGLIQWYTIPVLTRDAANQLMEEIRPLAQRIIAGFSIEWDGNSDVGRLDADAQAASDELAARCTPDDPDNWDDAELVDDVNAHDWWIDGDDDAREYLGISADTTDDELAAMVAAQEQLATQNTSYGCVVIHKGYDYLATLREQLRDELREDLRDVAAAYHRAKERRNDLIAQQVSWRDPHRDIAARAGLSHTAVQNIAAARAEDGK